MVFHRVIFCSFLAYSHVRRLLVLFTVQTTGVVYALYVITIASGSGFSCILLQIGPGSKHFKKTLGLQGIRRCFVKPTLNSK